MIVVLNLTMYVLLTHNKNFILIWRKKRTDELATTLHLFPKIKVLNISAGADLPSNGV